MQARTSGYRRQLRFSRLRNSPASLRIHQKKSKASYTFCSNQLLAARACQFAHALRLLLLNEVTWFRPTVARRKQLPHVELMNADEA